MGNAEKALEFYKLALEASKNVYGLLHRHTATTINNIAELFLKMKEYDKSLYWNYKSLYIRRKILSQDDPDMAMSYNNIAGVFDEKGLLQEALVGYKKALVIWVGQHGLMHPTAGTSCQNIALVFSKMYKFGKAFKWYIISLYILKHTIGDDYPVTISVLNNIKGAYVKSGRSFKDFDSWLANRLATVTLNISEIISSEID
jgi:tetratricopeptide (TPR) repeat protein